MSHILVLNGGSSSLRFRLFRLPGFAAAASGLIERIGSAEAGVHLETEAGSDLFRKIDECKSVRDHGEAMEIMAAFISEQAKGSSRFQLAAIGHRVVHGGERFRAPVRIDEAVIAAIEELVPLAPLHNPANLLGIRLAMARMPEVPQVAVFDTAFHQNMPEHAFLYGLPHELYAKFRVRRYGFHGTSHGYVCERAADFLATPPGELKIISLHLGNGASAAAVRHGRCVDTSMGMTPLEGLVMGTRCGDLDPAVPFYLAREAGMDPERLEEMLNRESGLFGICGDADMRTVIARTDAGDEQARLALELFCYRIRKYLGAYMAVLNGVDCVVFTGGIGEHAARVREKVCQDLEWLGIELDRERNRKVGRDVSAIHGPGSRIALLVVPTDEELAIARHTARIVNFPESVSVRACARYAKGTTGL